MAEPKLVTRVADSKPQFTKNFSMFIGWFEGELWGLNDWYCETFGRTELTFKSIHDPGMAIAYEILAAGKTQDKELITELVRKMEPHLVPNYDDLAPIERWKRMALQRPDDIGGRNKAEERRILTQRAYGRVLETMCGFNSYFAPAEHIEEVVVLDFCEEMLERYEYPERTRMLFDLERVVAGERMDFLPDGAFSTVGCWGSNYLSDPVPVFAEFARVLGNGGRLLILENSAEGYPDLVQRYFDPHQCAAWMKQAGLKTSIEPLPITQEHQPGDYYLVTGTRH